MPLVENDDVKFRLKIDEALKTRASPEVGAEPETQLVAVLKVLLVGLAFHVEV
jgi:hypothetical protein